MTGLVINKIAYLANYLLNQPHISVIYLFKNRIPLTLSCLIQLRYLFVPALPYCRKGT